MCNGAYKKFNKFIVSVGKFRLELGTYLNKI